MKVSFFDSNHSPLTILFSSVCLGIFSSAVEAANETAERDVKVTREVKLRTSLDRIYRLDGDDRYFSLVTGLSRSDESMLGDQLEVIPRELPGGTVVNGADGRLGIINRRQVLFANKAPHPAIADRMIINTTLNSYFSFTDETSSILSGKRSRAVLSGREAALLQRTPSSQLYASVNSADDSSDQDEGYFSRTANALATTPWFTVFQVHGHFSSQDKSDNVAGYKASGYGLQAALLAPVGDNWLIGALAGWQNLNAEVRNADGEVDAGTLRFGPTIAWADGPWHAEGLITHNWNDIDSKEVARKLNYKSNQWDGYARGGYDIDLSGLTPGLMLTPEMQLLYSHQKRKDGQSPFGNMSSATSSGWTGRLGAMINYDRFELQQPVELRLAAGWQHNGFKTADLEVSGRSTKLASDYKDDNSMYYSAGIDTLLNEQFNLSVSYAGNWSSKAYGHYIQAAVEFRF